MQVRIDSASPPHDQISYLVPNDDDKIGALVTIRFSHSPQGPLRIDVLARRASWPQGQFEPICRTESTIEAKTGEVHSVPLTLSKEEMLCRMKPVRFGGFRTVELLVVVSDPERDIKADASVMVIDRNQRRLSFGSFLLFGFPLLTVFLLTLSNIQSDDKASALVHIVTGGLGAAWTTVMSKLLNRHRLPLFGILLRVRRVLLVYTVLALLLFAVPSLLIVRIWNGTADPLRLSPASMPIPGHSWATKIRGISTELNAGQLKELMATSQLCVTENRSPTLPTYACGDPAEPRWGRIGFLTPKYYKFECKNEFEKIPIAYLAGASTAKQQCPQGGIRRGEVCEYRLRNDRCHPLRGETVSLAASAHRAYHPTPPIGTTTLIAKLPLRQADFTPAEQPAAKAGQSPAASWIHLAVNGVQGKEIIWTAPNRTTAQYPQLIWNGNAATNSVELPIPVRQDHLQTIRLQFNAGKGGDTIGELRCTRDSEKTDMLTINLIEPGGGLKIKRFQLKSDHVLSTYTPKDDWRQSPLWSCVGTVRDNRSPADVADIRFYELPMVGPLSLTLPKNLLPHMVNLHIDSGRLGSLKCPVNTGCCNGNFIIERILVSGPTKGTLVIGDSDKSTSWNWGEQELDSRAWVCRCTDEDWTKENPGGNFRSGSFSRSNGRLSLKINKSKPSCHWNRDPNNRKWCPDKATRSNCEKQYWAPPECREKGYYLCDC